MTDRCRNCGGDVDTTTAVPARDVDSLGDTRPVTGDDGQPYCMMACAVVANGATHPDDRVDQDQRLVPDGGDPGDHVVVGSWNDIDTAPEVVNGVEKEHVAAVFRNQDWDHVVWIPDWLLEQRGDDDLDVELLENSDHLAVGNVSDYSDKAWRFTQPHRKGDPGGYLPKSQVVVFERLDGLDDLNTPQRGLTEFAPNHD